MKHLPEQITHKGMLAGFVPVYCSSDGAFIVARWWWAECLLDMVDYFVINMNATPKLIFTGEVK